jgi:4-amino-4-deoxy-L-arabinose transferase-like glycosyltransferase
MLRTGDQDAPFACYTLLALLYFYEYVEKKRVFSIVAFTFFTIAAFLTKNLLAGLILPGMALYVVISGKLLPLLRDRRIYLSLFAILGAYAGTVGYLEVQYPGFVDRMWNYELMGRYSETIEGHSGGVFFYFKKLFNHHFTPIAYLVIPASYWLLKYGNDQKRSLTTFLLLSALGYLAIISFSGTKTGWYHAPVFPMIALVIATGINDFWENGRLHIPKWGFNIAIGLSLVIVAGSYAGALHKEAYRTPGYGLEGYNTFYTKVVNNDKLENPIWLFDNQFGTDTHFYSHVLSERVPEHQVEFQGHTEELEVGQQVMVCKGFAEKEIRDNFEVKVIANSHNCWVLELVSKK